MQSTSEKFAADSLELKVSIPMFLGQGSRQQADFFCPSTEHLSRLPLHNFTNCPKQATAQTNDQWCHDNSAHKLSVALVTRVRDLRRRQSEPGNPRTHLWLIWRVFR